MLRGALQDLTENGIAVSVTNFRRNNQQQSIILTLSPYRCFAHSAPLEQFYSRTKDKQLLLKAPLFLFVTVFLRQPALACPRGWRMYIYLFDFNFPLLHFPLSRHNVGATEATVGQRMARGVVRTGESLVRASSARRSRSGGFFRGARARTTTARRW